MRRLLSSMVLLSTLVACGPAVRSAGHTVTPDQAEDPDAERRASPGTPVDDVPQVTPTPTAQPTVEPTRPPLYAEVPDGGVLIGGEGPVALEGMGRGGHWVSTCSLPPGTKVNPRGTPAAAPTLSLHLGGNTETIDALLRAEDRGRYLVVLIEGRAWLVDAVAGKRLDLMSLSPDLRADRLADHRSFAFTGDGLVVLSSESDKTQKGYFLSLGDENPWTQPAASWARPIDWGKRAVWRVEGSERSFSATTLPEGSREKSWPVPQSDTSVHRCAAPMSAYDAFERLSSYRPDGSLEIRWAMVPAKKSPEQSITTEHTPGFVGPFANGWVRREDSGRLLLVSGKTQKQIASANCGARILRADVQSGFFLVACEEYAPVVPSASPSRKSKPKYRYDLYLIRPGQVYGLKVDLMRTGVDYFGPEEPSLTPIRPGSIAALVDFKARKMVPLEGELQVLATDEKQALLRKKNALALWTSTGEIPIDHQLPPLARVITHGPSTAVGDTMFLLGGELRTWKLPAAPLETTSQGYALIPKKAPEPSLWPEGPLLLIGPPAREDEPSAINSSPDK